MSQYQNFRTTIDLTLFHDNDRYMCATITTITIVVVVIVIRMGSLIVVSTRRVRCTRRCHRRIDHDDTWFGE